MSPEKTTLVVLRVKHPAGTTWTEAMGLPPEERWSEELRQDVWARTETQLSREDVRVDLGAPA